MTRRHILAVLIFSAMLALPARAQEATVTYKSLNPDVALDLARATLADWGVDHTVVPNIVMPPGPSEPDEFQARLPS